MFWTLRIFAPLKFYTWGEYLICLILNLILTQHSVQRSWPSFQHTELEPTWSQHSLVCCWPHKEGFMLSVSALLLFRHAGDTTCMFKDDSFAILLLYFQHSSPSNSGLHLHSSINSAVFLLMAKLWGCIRLVLFLSSWIFTFFFVEETLIEIENRILVAIRTLLAISPFWYVFNIAEYVF